MNIPNPSNLIDPTNSQGKRVTYTFNGNLNRGGINLILNQRGLGDWVVLVLNMLEKTQAEYKNSITGEHKLGSRENIGALRRKPPIHSRSFRSRSN